MRLFADKKTICFRVWCSYKMIQKVGPKIELCETPPLTFTVLLVFSASRMLYLSDRYDAIVDMRISSIYIHLSSSRINYQDSLFKAFLTSSFYLSVISIYLSIYVFWTTIHNFSLNSTKSSFQGNLNKQRPDKSSYWTQSSISRRKGI